MSQPIFTNRSNPNSTIMSKFSEQVHIAISSFSQNVIYYDLQLSKKMAEHHYFSFMWQYTAKAVIEPADQAAALSKHIGAEVILKNKVNLKVNNNFEINL